MAGEVLSLVVTLFIFLFLGHTASLRTQSGQDYVKDFSSENRGSDSCPFLLLLLRLGLHGLSVSVAFFFFFSFLLMLKCKREKGQMCVTCVSSHSLCVSGRGRKEGGWCLMC